MVPIFRPCRWAKADEVGQARHGAVVVHDLADHAGGRRGRPGARGRQRPRCGRRGPARRRRAPAAGRCGRAGRGRRRPLAASIATCTVRARSAAEMPVVTPSRASIETVKAVPSAGARCAAPSAAGAAARSARAVSVRQIRPRPCVAMKLIASGVTRSRGEDRGRPRSRGPRRRPGRPSGRAGLLDDLVGGREEGHVLGRQPQQGLGHRSSYGTFSGTPAGGRRSAPACRPRGSRGRPRGGRGASCGPRCGG